MKAKKKQGDWDELYSRISSGYTNKSDRHKDDDECEPV